MPKKKNKRKSLGGRPALVRGSPVDVSSRVGEATASKLTRAAEKNGISRAAVIRRIIEEWASQPARERERVVRRSNE